MQSDGKLTQNQSTMNVALYGVFLSMGAFYAANQLLIHHITKAFHAGDSQMAMMVSALYAGPMLMVLYFGTFSDRVGRRSSVLLALLIVCIGTLIILLSHSILLTTAGFLIYGIGIGGTECVMITITSEVNKDRAGQILQLNQALFSIGAMIAPIMIAVFLTAKEYRIPYAIILFLTLLAVSFFRQINKEHGISDPTEHKKNVSIFSLIRHPRILFYMVTIIIVTGSESALTYWAGVYFDTLKASEIGVVALSSYWCASIFGRLFCSRIHHVENVLLPCLVSAAAGTLCLVVLPLPGLKLIGFLIVGVAFAPLYPSLGHLASKQYPQNIGAAFALITFSSNLGGVLSQPVISIVSEKLSITMIYAAIALLCGLLSLIAYVIRRLEYKNRKIK